MMLCACSSNIEACRFDGNYIGFVVYSKSVGVWNTKMKMGIHPTCAKPVLKDNFQK